MKRHTTSGRTSLGLALAFFTAVLWGTMPVGLKVLVGTLDAWTLSTGRFLVAGLLLVPLVVARHGGRALLGAVRRPLLTIGCIAGIGGNYVFYQTGLRFIPPDAAQVIVQISPALALIGGLVIFHERFGRFQWVGLAALLAGMALFFNTRWAELLVHTGSYSLGVLLVAVSAVFWAGYMLAQKQLLVEMAPETILAVTYLAAAVLLFPAATPARLFTLAPRDLVLFFAVSLATLVSYLSFAAAMNHLEASRMGAIVAVSPLLTVANAALISRIAPGVVSVEHLNALSIVGAVLVVAGSMLTTLARPRPRVAARAAGPAS